MSRLVNDLFEVSELAHHGPENLFISIVLLIGSFILLCRLNVKLTLIIFAFIPVLCWFSYIKRRRLSVTSRRTRERIGEVNADLQNSISGVRVSKAFENSGHELRKFQTGNKAYEDARSDQYRAMAEFFSGTSLILDLLLLITLIAGGLFTYHGSITVGDFAAYLIFAGLFT